LYIKHPTSNIQHQTSNIPSPLIKHPHPVIKGIIFQPAVYFLLLCETPLAIINLKKSFMKSISKNVVMITLLTSASLFLFSFSKNKGGEGFEIYLNSKLVVQQFGNNMNTLKTISLDKSQSASQLSVKYFHCGRPGKDRTIAIKDANNKILKQWHFPDVSAASVAVNELAMNFKVSDVLGLQKSNTGNLSLYYSSNELPKGRVLATLVCEGSFAKH